ncbi:MAG: Stk1 family PASTA domain-containing Ser/Thr kinase [Clostridia bacterium]|nr:Stk1 family PASTA domain-containing Ser/Thr kinase [Clostridia bacterium]
MDLVGKILGNRYEVLEMIGSGGMATVYEARCKLLNRKVAIKVLKDEFSNDAEFIKRFQVEAQSAASLSHPNIVSIYDVGNEDGLHYIVMELIKGKTLKEVINEDGKLKWDIATNIASQIASGLEQAHKNHIVHRDIKPHNIIITKDGIAKVTDFGIAKAVSNSTINAYGTTVGSVHYFSPEHARGGYTDEKSDIYSLGVVLYEMVTGKLPFNADTPVSVALKHIQETPAEPITIDSSIPQALNDVIIKAMQKEVNDRYASASMMNADLQKVLRTPNAGIATQDKNLFVTQKVPIVGVTDRMETRNVMTSDIKIKNGGEEEMKKSKKITKKQAVVRLLLYILLAIAIVFISMAATIKIMDGMDSSNVVVKKIVGMHKDEAQAVLEDLGLVMEIQATVESSQYPKDYITYQEYAEGRELKAGATVGVRVSKGAKTVFVPDVTTMSIEAAKIKIEENKLVFKQETIQSSEVPEGEIVSQSPIFNTEVEEGTEVIVFVSAGVTDGMVVVPNVVDKTEAEARQILDTAKLIITVNYINEASKPDGKVINQDIEEGTMVSELTEIVITVNNVNGKVENPNAGNDSEPKPNTGTTKPEEEGETISIDVSKKGVRDVFTLKVEVQSSSVGKKIIYEGVHSRNDKTVNVTIPKGLSGMLRVYIDDKLDSEMVF